MKTIPWTLIFIVSSASLVFGQSDDLRKKNFNTRKNIAIDGYDPVSYFDNKPVEGREQFPVAHRGITYWFVDAANAGKFKSMPEKYEPAYGGWCAYAMGASGDKVKVDPETFKILDGKLYLFYSFWGNNTLSDWNKNEKELKRKGDQNWKKFIP